MGPVLFLNSQDRYCLHVCKITRISLPALDISKQLK
jgi:hypothetical protein